MPRWQPDTQERLVRAALDLYTEQGYELTTVGQIADRAGVTSRTYFRYFPDKREVLFVNSKLVDEAIVEATREALTSQPPLDAVLTGVAAAGSGFGTHEFGLRRGAVVAANEELREREAMKVAMRSESIATVLREAGYDEVTSRIAAELGGVVFTEAARRWYLGDQAPFGELVEQAAAELRKAMA